MPSRNLLVAVDIGGTFTDVTLQDAATGRAWTAKTPSTPANPSEGFITGVTLALTEARRNPAEVAKFMTMFKVVFEAEGIHPLEGGVVRMKYRSDRRYGMPIEPVGVFHWKLAVETVRKLKIYGRLAWQGWRIGQRVKNDPKRHEYTDLALQPVMDDDMDKLSLFAETAGGGAAVNKRRGEDLARAKIAAQQNQRLAAAE